MLVPPCDNWPHCTSSNNVFVSFFHLSLSVSSLNFITVINTTAGYLLRCPARTSYSLEHACYVVSFFIIMVLIIWLCKLQFVNSSNANYCTPPKGCNPSKYRILVNKLAHSKHDGSNERSNKKEHVLCQKVMISYRIKHVSYQ